MFLRGKICVSARVASRFGYIWHRSFIQTVKCSFFDEKFVYQSFYDAPYTLSYFLLQGKVLCFSTRRLTWSKKLYLRLYFIQIVHSVHSYGKMLFLAPNNFASLTFFKEKLCVSARVSKLLAWTVFTCVEKMLSFGCVCCMKMGLKRVSPVPFDKKTVNFWLNGKNNLHFN